MGLQTVVFTLLGLISSGAALATRQFSQKNICPSSVESHDTSNCVSPKVLEPGIPVTFKMCVALKFVKHKDYAIAHYISSRITNVNSCGISPFGHFCQSAKQLIRHGRPPGPTA